MSVFHPNPTKLVIIAPRSRTGVLVRHGFAQVAHLIIGQNKTRGLFSRSLAVMFPNYPTFLLSSNPESLKERIIYDHICIPFCALGMTGDCSVVRATGNSALLPKFRHFWALAGSDLPFRSNVLISLANLNRLDFLENLVG